MKRRSTRLGGGLQQVGGGGGGEGVAAEREGGHQNQEGSGEGAVAAQGAAGFDVGVWWGHGRLPLPWT